MAETSSHSIQLSFPLPKSPDTKIHLRLTVQTASILLFLTTATSGDNSTLAPLGSFVYALPDRVNSGQTLSTPLYTYESSVEFTTRLSKLLARKTGRPVYVGNSISFSSTGMGGTVEEEMEGFKKVVQVVMEEVKKHGGIPSGSRLGESAVSYKKYVDMVGNTVQAVADDQI